MNLTQILNGSGWGGVCCFLWQAGRFFAAIDDTHDGIHEGTIEGTIDGPIEDIGGVCCFLWQDGRILHARWLQSTHDTIIDSTIDGAHDESPWRAVHCLLPDRWLQRNTSIDSTHDGIHDGIIDGTIESSMDSAIDGIIDGFIHGTIEGIINEESRCRSLHFDLILIRFDTDHTIRCLA